MVVARFGSAIWGCCFGHNGTKGAEFLDEIRSSLVRSTSFNISISISIHIATLWVSYCWCRISAFKPVGFVSEIDILNTVHLYTVYLLIAIECHVIALLRLIQIVWSCEAIWMIKTLAMLARLLVSWRSLAGGHSYCRFLGLSWCGGWVLVQMKLDIS